MLPVTRVVCRGDPGAAAVLRLFLVTTVTGAGKVLAPATALALGEANRPGPN